MHIPERRPFTGPHPLKSFANLALSWTVSGGGRREPGDWGEGLIALRGSEFEENPSITGRGPA